MKLDPSAVSDQNVGK